MKREEKENMLTPILVGSVAEKKSEQGFVSWSQEEQVTADWNNTS